MFVGLAVLLMGISTALAVNRQQETAQWLAFARSEYHTSGCTYQNTSIMRGVVDTDHLQPMLTNLGMVIRISFDDTGQQMVYDESNPSSTQVRASTTSGYAYRCYYQLYVHNLDDNSTRWLDVGLDDARAPAWSPTGEWIAFIGEVRTEIILLNGQPAFQDDHFVYIVRPDGTDLQLLAPTIRDSRVSWSPDGTTLVYPAAVDGSSFPEIFSINIEDGLPQRLTFNNNVDLTPVFSPDGEKIAFLSDRNRADFNYDVFEMQSNGTLQQQVEFSNNPSWALIFSDDATRIYFVTEDRFTRRFSLVESLMEYDLGARRQPDGYFKTEIVEHVVTGTDGEPVVETSRQTYQVWPPEPSRVSPDDFANYWAPTLAPAYEVPWTAGPLVGGGAVLLLLGGGILWRPRRKIVNSVQINQS